LPVTGDDPVHVKDSPAAEAQTKTAGPMSAGTVGLDHAFRAEGCTRGRLFIGTDNLS